jgi:hypothetical protein
MMSAVVVTLFRAVEVAVDVRDKIRSRAGSFSDTQAVAQNLWDR